MWNWADGFASQVLFLWIKLSGAHWIESWVGPIPGLDTAHKSLALTAVKLNFLVKTVA
jgi:hypothetical protein